ncbi:uncharacterized protein LOC119331500 isoform X2 [Triticum dicoccoides]|uniref:uncharacterized protein LOC119331500 isoform X2 n=1 Tax=Triticum dicoccoides TaxID=85692 RepID=UPI001890E2C6|nr:uncharacterized protein LOC119331500 isoform X2 [Triticum dicoccoides]
MALFLLASPADPLAPFLPLSSSSSPKPHPPGHRDTSWWSSTVHHRPTPGRPRMGPGSPDLAPGGPDRQKAALPARGGHFLRDPHVDLLIWCVPAGRLGGLLLGQVPLSFFPLYKLFDHFVFIKCHNTTRDSRETRYMHGLSDVYQADVYR